MKTAQIKLTELLKARNDDTYIEPSKLNGKPLNCLWRRKRSQLLMLLRASTH